MLKVLHYLHKPSTGFTISDLVTIFSATLFHPIHICITQCKCVCAARFRRSPKCFLHLHNMLSSLFKLHFLGHLYVLMSSIFSSYKTYVSQKYFVFSIRFHLEFLLLMLMRRIPDTFLIFTVVIYKYKLLLCLQVFC